MTITTSLEIKRVAGRIGAEVKGVKLTKDIEPEILEQLRAALTEHLVLFFRGQDHLDDESHEAFAKRIDDLYAHPTVPVKEGSKAILELNSDYGGKANSWHTDVSFVPDIPKYSVLRGVEIPSVGGDTVWANTHTAYEDLPENLKVLAENTWAIHSNKFDYAAYIKNDEDLENFRKVFVSTEYETRHPLVFKHSESGKKHLLLGHFIRQFEGYSTSESSSLFNIFQSYVTRLENTVRWNWQKGDLIIWDNLATQHYAIADYDEKRVVRRVTVGSDTPESIKGEKGTVLKPLDN